MKRTDAESQTFVQKWVLAIVGICIALFIFPPAGLILGVAAGWYASRAALRRQRQNMAERQRNQYVAWRGDPANQHHMPGNGTNGGLSIEERNAYRRAANALQSSKTNRR